MSKLGKLRKNAQSYEFINEIIKDYQFYYRIIEYKRIYMEEN